MASGVCVVCTVSIRPRATPSFISSRRSTQSASQTAAVIDRPGMAGGNPARNSTSLA